MNKPDKNVKISLSQSNDDKEPFLHKNVDKTQKQVISAKQPFSDQLKSSVDEIFSQSNPRNAQGIITSGSKQPSAHRRSLQNLPRDEPESTRQEELMVENLAQARDKSEAAIAMQQEAAGIAHAYDPDFGHRWDDSPRRQLGNHPRARWRPPTVPPTLVLAPVRQSNAKPHGQMAKSTSRKQSHVQKER
jgi:hypothetical protein